jgi:RNA polymerase sigma factor for flagellar operon FliA
MSASTRLYAQVQSNHESHNAEEALVMAHLGLVKRVAMHLKVRIPPFMELDELIQLGMIGLLEAARAYDPTKGIEFENFAHTRVRGAMLDEVRRLSFLPRSAVAFNKSHGKATDDTDALHSDRAKEVTSLWRLAAA